MPSGVKPKTTVMKFLLAFLLSVSFFSCRFIGAEKVNGDGNVVSQSRKGGNFEAIEVSGSFKIDLRQGAASSVDVNTDQNLQEYVDVYIENNTLYVKEKEGYNLRPSEEIKVSVVAPMITAVDLSGSCNLTGGTFRTNKEFSISVSGAGEVHMNIEAPKVHTDISGSGIIELGGQVKQFEAEISGSGDMRCSSLEAEDVMLDLSGAAEADVWASKTLDIQASGAATINYKGNPSVKQSISGAGSVNKQG